ncbi:MAG TPA: zinc-binding dehydrogenase [Candidatus Saccharimonadales bacterium]|nr:zinc-binding dehydrogenase [Candidatus Saccharimonadales bacterium]
MRSASLVAPGRIEIKRVCTPQPGPGEVSIRLEGCGVCGSNLAPWEGRPWFTYPFEPGAPGHEGWGVVERLGEGVDTVKIGTRVAFIGSRSFAEFEVVPEKSVVSLPEELARKPFPGEALGCAFNVIKRCDIKPGQRVAVVGVGFLGAVLCALCAQKGASVIAISRRGFALELAKYYGAADTLPFEDKELLVQKVMERTAGRGCERVIEAVGNQEALDLATEITQERGRLIIAGYHQDGMRQVNMQLWNWRGLDVINAHERDPRIYVQGIRDAAAAVATGQLDTDPLFTHTYPLEEIGRAFEAMQKRPAGFLKALVTL